jgi:hypothetical protein
MRRVVPLATPTLFLEYEDVLKRPEQRKASGLSLYNVKDFREAAPRFGLRVLRPAELLLEIMG